MQRIANINISELQKTINNLLLMSEKYAVCSILNSNNFCHDKYSNYKLLAAFGLSDFVRVKSNDKNSLSKINSFINKNKGNWIFGYINYDLKNQIENLESQNIDNIGFDDAYFFVPQHLVVANNSIEIYSNTNCSQEYSDIFVEELLNDSINDELLNPKEILEFKHRINRSEYLQQIESIREHIKLGDIYEMNFCQEFYINNINLKPANFYNKLNKTSPSPFSAFVKENNKYLMSASPERYIQKKNNQLITQPIKGTAKRSPNKEIDYKAKENLRESIKERAENIMIVDLVRNDLSRISTPESVRVEELCKIYTFPHVHQMISTVVSEQKENITFGDILKSTFPMGSMTGAPKIRAMEIIEKYETSKRGLFSGSVGYITPGGDFDFNVIIRSLQYNIDNKYLNLITGGAITYLSNPKAEYEESLLKANAIFNTFRKV